jgi:hypothetical protein
MTLRERIFQFRVVRIWGAAQEKEFSSSGWSEFGGQLKEKEFSSSGWSEFGGQLRLLIEIKNLPRNRIVLINNDLLLVGDANVKS